MTLIQRNEAAFFSKLLGPAALGTALVSSLVSACAMRDPTPSGPVLGPAGGYAPDDFDTSIACENWDAATSDWDAKKHVSFPDAHSVGCFAPVFYEEDGERVSHVKEPIGKHCGYPNQSLTAQLIARAELYETLAEKGPTAAPLPLEIACDLPPAIFRATAKHNGLVLRSLASGLPAGGQRYPYALAGTFGFGSSSHDESRLIGWLPEQPCRSLSPDERALLQPNPQRAARVTEAYRSGLSPVTSVSGGAVHSSLIEAFMLLHLAHCDGGVPRDRILLDPCADHTHTNVRNTGALVIGIGGRHAYVMTDDGLQAGYLQEYTAFDLMGGSIDQRARRDFGHLIGAWRQASFGLGNQEAGFWFSPYRFWAEPERGLGSFHCVGDL